MRRIVFALIILASATPLAASAQNDRVIRGRMPEVFRYVFAEGADEELFDRVTSLAFDANGNLYALDVGNSRIVVIDATGKYLRQFGRKGSGPGEFKSPRSLTVTDRGDVAVLDYGRNAYVTFTRDGRYQRDVPFPKGFTMCDDCLIAAAAGHRITLQAKQLQNDPRGSGTSMIISHVLEPEGDVQIVSRLAPPSIAPARAPVKQERRDVMTNRVRALAFRPLYAALPNGGAVVTTSIHYNVEVHDPAGRVTSLRRPVKPVAVTRKVEEAWKADVRARTAALQKKPGVIYVAPSVDNVIFDDSASAISGMRVSPQGTIWIQRRAIDGRSNGPIDILSARGAYMSTLPAQPLPDAISADGLVAYLEKDTDGVEHIVVKQLPAEMKGRFE